MFDVILAMVTLASLGLAGVMGIVTWRVLSVERRRFDARVEELSAAAAESDRQDGAPASVGARLVTSVAPAVSTNAPGAQPGLFAGPLAMASYGRRLIVAAGLGLTVLVLAFALVIALNPVAAGRSGVSPSAARAVVPVELVSLDHARVGRGLSIHGLLRNPAGGALLRDLIVVVFLFNGNGEQVGTTQAAVRATALAPGGETPFDVPVADGQHVARYRVTFRMASAPVPHVDRRMAPRSATPDPVRAAAGRGMALATPPAQ